MKSKMDELIIWVTSFAALLGGAVLLGFALGLLWSAFMFGWRLLT